MAYKFGEELKSLASWLGGQGADISELKSERQALFFVMKLSGEKIRFPPKGASCYPQLLALQERIKKRLQDGTLPKPLARSSVAKKPKNHQQQIPRMGKNSPREGKKFRFEIYTDGACEPNPGLGGWGFAVFHDGVEIESFCGGEQETTNNRMELQAILRALAWVYDNGRNALIYTDSKYCADGINSWMKNWKKKGWKRGQRELLNSDLWRTMDEMISPLDVEVEWVRGHDGNEGNERSDELAELGRQSL